MTKFQQKARSLIESNFQILRLNHVNFKSENIVTFVIE